MSSPAAGAEDVHAVLHRVDAELVGEEVHLVDVHLGAGGRLHDDRVGEDGRQEHAGDGIGQLDAGLAELKRDDGGRGADGEVQKEDGVGRGNIGDAMVVDDLDDIGVLDTRGRLADLVVIHEDDLLLDFLAIALDRVHVFDEHRLGDVVLLQNPGAFHRQRPQTGGHVLDGVGLAVAAASAFFRCA